MTDKKNELSMDAANKIAAQIRSKPNTNLGLPTGRTPVLMYDYLVKLTEKEGLDWSQVNCFALDEYLNTTAEHSFQRYLETNLYDRIGFPKTNQHNPSMSDNYDAIIAQHGGLDLAILGIGLNGHIAFNEPGTPRLSFTQCIWLDEVSRKALSPTFGGMEATPSKAVTMGISTILASKQIIMLAFGQDKKEIVGKAFSNGINPEIPASFLTLHEHLTVLTD
ncbi:glucosamine-6-phosphate deaminase [Candidatus Obscuribacterales bacterium]|nr:glucosamine-6-phosphate deaminase [Candidatus Obscuribacterales bacterium]